jgi:hypothetical protein
MMSFLSMTMLLLSSLLLLLSTSPRPLSALIVDVEAPDATAVVGNRTVNDLFDIYFRNSVYKPADVRLWLRTSERLGAIITFRTQLSEPYGTLGAIRIGTFGAGE